MSRFNRTIRFRPLTAAIAFPIAIALFVGTSQAEDPLQKVIEPFLNAYCVKCHGLEVQKADRRFDHLFASSKPSAEGPKDQPLKEHSTDGRSLTIHQAEMLQEILDQLNLGNMPPGDQAQPSAADLKKVVAMLTSSIAKVREESRENVGKVVLRRLNRVEYRNTIRDLFQLKMIDFDPTSTFPSDDSTDGFDNVGEGLVTSDYLLSNYLEAARKVADKAIRPGTRPEMIHYQMGGTAGLDSNSEILSGVSVDKEGRKEAGRLFIKFRQPLGIQKLDKKRGVPADGEYVIRFSAQAVRRKSRYKDEDLRYNSNEPMRLSISIDSRELGPTAHRIIGEYEIPDDTVVEVEHRVWLERGFTFHVHWANGPNGSFKRILRKVLPKYNEDALYPIRNPPEMYVGSGPELHVQTLEIEGPFFDEWPPEGFARFFPDPPRQPTANYLDECLMRIASKAFRRPVRNDELEPYLLLARRYFEKHGNFWAAAKYGVRAILTSPHFLYLSEPAVTNSTDRKVGSHELATRLSYFLWSSMPDDELRKAADDGSLRDSAVLLEQVERMLRDPKSAALATNFVEQWLGLRKLGEMPPDPEQNPAYYAENLEDAMRTETRLFFSHILNKNRSLLEFVDADYTFVNAALARHYGLPGLQLPAEKVTMRKGAVGSYESSYGRNVSDSDNASFPEGFEKVTLRADSNRGGLLGHGSILTATSNGVETQPVVRGVWVLENLLGSPPSPPPPDVEPIEPDTRGVTTIRQLMKKHRSNPTCYECHRKIDPIGLSMENYDHVGAWRDRYSKQLPINSSGELPDGTVIPGPDGIKDYLLKRPDQFARCLTEKLLIYALGRRLSFADRDDVDRIVSDLQKRNYGLRNLVQQIVLSEAFRSK